MERLSLPVWSADTHYLKQQTLGKFHVKYYRYSEPASQIRTTALSDKLLPEGCGQHPQNGALHEQKTPSQSLT